MKEVTRTGLPEQRSRNPANSVPTGASVMSRRNARRLFLGAVWDAGACSHMALIWWWNVTCRSACFSSCPRTAFADSSSAAQPPAWRDLHSRLEPLSPASKATNSTTKSRRIGATCGPLGAAGALDASAGRLPLSTVAVTTQFAWGDAAPVAGVGQAGRVGMTGSTIGRRAM